jgi:hypothetical protein
MHEMSQVRTPKPRTTPYAPEKAARLRADIRDRSAEVVAAEAGFSVNTLMSLAGGKGCNDSTKLLADIYLSGRQD